MENWPYSGVYWIAPEKLSPKLQESLKLPSWELHYSLVETIVDRARKEIGWYHMPFVSDSFYDHDLNRILKNSAGYIYQSSTYGRSLIAELPLRIEWYYVGLFSHYSDLYLAFFPRLRSVDNKDVHTIEKGWYDMTSNYFAGFETALVKTLDFPYLFRPNSEAIVKVEGKKSPYKFKLASEDIGRKAKKKKKHPLLRGED